MALSAKIAAHELGHLVGLLHQDSFGPIGYGPHAPPGGAAYNPDYPGPSAGFETFNHLMSSPASVGSNRTNDLRDLYFGEREAVKLTVSESGTVLAESAAPTPDVRHRPAAHAGHAGRAEYPRCRTQRPQGVLCRRPGGDRGDRARNPGAG